LGEAQKLTEKSPDETAFLIVLAGQNQLVVGRPKNKMPL
jgi:hypothetical protein